MLATGQDQVLLDATLRPSPPLPPSALKLILVLVATINLAFAMVFVSRGAWLVMPFMGLDVLLLAWAFRASLRAAQRSERICVTADRLVVERHPVRGPVSEIELNPYWVRVEMADPPDHWSQLTLWSHGKGVRIGTFLSPDERASLALSLKDALRRAREHRAA